MSFTIPKGQEVAPLDMSNPEALAEGMRTFSADGVVLFSGLPPDMRTDYHSSTEAWAEHTASKLLAALESEQPGSVPSRYSVTGKSYIQRAGYHTGAHYDGINDPIFYGLTEQESAEFRASSAPDRNYHFAADPDTLWVLAGKSLVGGKGMWHELGEPTGGRDRIVNLGAVISKDRFGVKPVK